MLMKKYEGQFSDSDDESGRFVEWVPEKRLYSLGQMWDQAPREKRGLGHSDHGGMMGASEKAKPLVSKKGYIWVEGTLVRAEMYHRLRWHHVLAANGSGGLASLTQR